MSSKAMFRLQRVKNLLTEKNLYLNGILISSTPTITYLTNYSGFSILEREAYLFITKSESYLLTDGRYTEAVRNIPNFVLIEISPINSLQKMLIHLANKHNIKKLGIEENNLTVSEYKRLKKCFNDLNHFSIRDLRSIKDKGEIFSIEQACQLGDKTFDYILKKIKQGVTEKEIAFEIEFFIKKAGADISFKPIVAFGKNSAIPHHQTSDKQLAIRDKFVLLDFGAKIDNYCSDMTRTVFFGKANAEQKKMHQIVLDAQNQAIDYLYSSRERSESRSEFSTSSNNKIHAKDVDKVARDYITSQGYPTIPHSLGHGIGLEVHESPSLSPKSKDILKPGMVFSIEPGIYIAGFGGVRIEDLVILEPSGPRLLTKSPKSFIELPH